MSEKYIGCCARYGREGLKKNMTALYMKDGSYGQVRILCHFCRGCFDKFLEEHELQEP